VTFDYLANLRKLKKNFFEGWAGVMKRGVLIKKSLIKEYWRGKRLSSAGLESTYQHQGVLEGKTFEYRRSRVYLSTSRSTGGEKI
jgi:hypothetical protein